MKFIPEIMIPDYGEDVYEKLSEIIGLKFKSQLKNSGIALKQIHEFVDLISNERFYLLTTNSDSIKFANKDEFIQKFILLIKRSINKLNTDYQDLQKHYDLPVVDENLIFLENERIGYCGERQLTLLNKMRDFRTVIPSVND